MRIMTLGFLILKRYLNQFVSSYSTRTSATLYSFLHTVWLEKWLPGQVLFLLSILVQQFIPCFSPVLLLIPLYFLQICGNIFYQQNPHQNLRLFQQHPQLHTTFFSTKTRKNPLCTFPRLSFVLSSFHCVLKNLFQKRGFLFFSCVTASFSLVASLFGKRFHVIFLWYLKPQIALLS